MVNLLTPVVTDILADLKCLLWHLLLRCFYLRVGLVKGTNLVKHLLSIKDTSFQMMALYGV